MSMTTPCNQADNSIPEENYLSYTVIHKYSPNSNMELKGALIQNYDLIVLSDVTLGERVCKWIQFGNILHKSAVLSGITCLVLNISTDTADWFIGCLSFCSFFSIATYNALWRKDIVSSYQLDTRGDFVSQLPLSSVKSRSVVVLVKRDDKYRRFLHNLIGCLLLIQLGRRVVHWNV